MLISPPFLPATNGPAGDNWLNNAMTNANNEGAYPVTKGLAWHGGMHLVSPANILVRAIADGTVAYVRKATPKNNNEDDPLNYHAGGSLAGWTSDGCVIIRHDTEIGEGENSNVRFFSIYMHLEDIPANITKDKAIYRKDSIGKAGYINGQTSRIHFEIICDDANIVKLVGRGVGDAVINADGRSDAVYGDMYFYLPAATPLFAAKPHTQPAANAIAPVPTHTTSADLFVGIRYAAGHGHVTTYQSNGTIVGTAPQEDDFEYTLYKKATDLHTQCPSAAYELLRFGRVLGPDALAPADTPHWRQVCYPGGQGWVNLAPAAIHKFSDADFPHWRGWTLIDDSSDLNSRMDAPIIRDWLDTDHDGKVTPDEARGQLLTLEVQNKLKGAICRLPTEWNVATIDARWDWLKTVTPEHPEKLTNEDFEGLRRHISKLSFWAEANLGIDANHWHFDPREFIRHFRKCGWLSEKELKRTMPGATMENVGRFKVPLNNVMRKYMGPDGVRRSHFIGQLSHETGNLAGSMAERGNSDGSKLYEADSGYFEGADNYSYFRAGLGYERLRNTLGNEYSPTGTGDGIKFRGRGSLQVTGRGHYSIYWVYRGWIATSSFDVRWWAQPGWWNVPRNQTIRPAMIPDPQRISARASGNEYNPIDAGGWFWADRSINQACSGESYTSSIALKANAVSTIINRYDTPTFQTRKTHVETVKRILCDGI